SGISRYHPLLREFLLGRLRSEDPDRFACLCTRAVDDALALRRWDDALDVASRAHDRTLLVQAVEAATMPLARAGRFRSLGGWLEACEPIQPDEDALQVARLRVLCESGQVAKTVALAED